MLKAENYKAYVGVSAEFRSDGVMLPRSLIWEDGVTYEMTALKIASASLPAGSYTLTLKRADEQLTLTLKLGSK